MLAGWVLTRRDHGKLVFIDLWDREGMTQVVVHPATSNGASQVAHELRAESVVAVTRRRAAASGGHRAPALATGDIEVAARRIDVLNAARALPFALDEHHPVDETLALRYRYLDLRAGVDAAKPARLRHRVVKGCAIFSTLRVSWRSKRRSSAQHPRGRTRLCGAEPRPRRGRSTHWPQSPQQIKQLLMIAGVDRFFQVARCFRDDDLRADRQPEFTQLDRRWLRQSGRRAGSLWRR